MNRRAQVFLTVATQIFAAISAAKTLIAATNKNMAQQVIETVAAAHPEVIGLELAASRSKGQECKTIAATEAKEIGERCDKDELTAMKTNQPFVEQEKDGFDVTIPLHDASGQTIATLGIDFKPEAGQAKASVTKNAKQIASEVERKVTSREQLFKPAQ